jgi:hypothetical protein
MLIMTGESLVSGGLMEVSDLSRNNLPSYLQMILNDGRSVFRAEDC